VTQKHFWSLIATIWIAVGGWTGSISLALIGIFIFIVLLYDDQRHSKKSEEHNHDVATLQKSSDKIDSVKRETNELLDELRVPVNNLPEPDQAPKPYIGGQVFIIRGSPHQFNGTGFEQIDVSRTYFLYGKDHRWNGKTFIPVEKDI
jgi:hypothetical protein